ncbi:MAG: stage II sporulation protein M, partial [Saprospiraceae bacterium]
MYESRWEFLIALLIFWVPFVMGCLSGFMGEEEEFARQLLGNDYIDMTIANIQSGDPMAIYKDQNQLTMFATIFLNNLMVSLRYFVVGALFTVGSIVSMVFWGLYVGAFQYFFFEQGELIPSILGIWTHGSLEIPESIIAGTAGIVLGKGLVFPGTYSRMQAFLLSARKGVKIIVGAIPLVLAAAFIECFITRLTDTPDILRASFITINFTFVFLYFVALPYFLGTTNFMKKLPLMGIATGVGVIALAVILFLVAAPSPLILTMIGIPVVALLVVKGFAIAGQFESRPEVEEEDKLEPEKKTTVNFDRMKTAGEVFQDVFLVYRKNVGKIFMAALITASIFLIGTLLFTAGRPSDIFGYPSGLQYFIEDFFKFISAGFFEESQYIGQFFTYKGSMISAMF